MRRVDANGRYLRIRLPNNYGVLICWLAAACLFIPPRFAIAHTTAPTAESQEPPGTAVFNQHCSACHENGATGAPAKSILQFSMSPATIYRALTIGRMRGQGAQLSDLQIRQVVEYLTGRKVSQTEARAPKACGRTGLWFDSRQSTIGVGWGIDFENTRLISTERASLEAQDLKRLKLKWAFAYPNLTRAVSQPLLAGGGLFVGSQDGTVYALDATSGCMHWSFKAEAEIAGTLVIRENAGKASGALFFGDRFAYVYSIDAASGTPLWKVKMDNHPAAEVVGTPVLVDDRLYVPIASLEELSIAQSYSCCTFRGSVVAMDPADGRVLWKRYTIPDPAKEQCKNAEGKPQFGPSGAGVWTSVTVDKGRKRLYFGTGNNYSVPDDNDGDAIFAIDLSSGEIVWRTPTTDGDFWNTWDEACKRELRLAELPKSGPDIDFTAPPVLVHGQDQKDILVAGRKDGTIFGIDPDNGSIRWKTRITEDANPYAAQLLFGLMVEGSSVFAPSQGSNEPGAEIPMESQDDGLHALDVFTGSLKWKSPVSADCQGKAGCLGIAFAPIGIPGVVFAGAQDGILRAYDTQTGKVIWKFETNKYFRTLNGEKAKGGSLERNGLIIGHGMVYVNSGYGRLPGNVLLALGVNK